MANHLPIEKKILVLSSLVEGNSIRSIERMTNVNRNTIMSLLVSTGAQAQEILDREMVNIQSKRIQVDEIWTFVAKKQKRLKPSDNGEVGDQYVFVALDADTKLVPVFRAGRRDGRTAHSFITELATRIITRFQLSTDSFKAYFDVVDRIFGTEIDYGHIHKHYGEGPEGGKRYSPADIIRVTINALIGQPIRRHISTSYVERQNLTMRMQMRRFTRLTNAFSKKLDNLKAALALHFFHYNFMRIHQSLRVTLAMEAGITRRILTWNDLLNWQEEAKAA